MGRVVTGVGNGMNTSTIPTYQAGELPDGLDYAFVCNWSALIPETSRSNNRGPLFVLRAVLWPLEH